VTLTQHVGTARLGATGQPDRERPPLAATVRLSAAPTDPASAAGRDMVFLQGKG
jgi:hypothetical protein